MTCAQSCGRLLMAVLFLVLGISMLSDPAQREASVQDSLRKTTARLDFLTGKGAVKAITVALAGFLVVGSILLLINAKERYCILGTTLLLYAWLVEGLVTNQFTHQSIGAILQDCSLMGGLLLS